MCDPEPRLCSFAFRSSEVLKLLLDLDHYGGCDPLGFYPLFLQKSARILVPKLSVVLRFLVRHGEFPGCLLSAYQPLYRKDHSLVCLLSTGPSQ